MAKKTTKTEATEVKTDVEATEVQKTDVETTEVQKTDVETTKKAEANNLCFFM